MPVSAVLAVTSGFANAAGIARSSAPTIATPASETLRIEDSPCWSKRGSLEARDYSFSLV